jgi:hypothetical protein
MVCPQVSCTEGDRPALGHSMDGRHKLVSSYSDLRANTTELAETMQEFCSINVSSKRRLALPKDIRDLGRTGLYQSSEELEKLEALITYQVSRFTACTTDDMRELFQEGMLTICEILTNHEQPDVKHLRLAAKRKINSRLKKLRREQWHISKVSNRVAAYIGCPMALPNYESINTELNRTCIQRALDRLNPEETFAIVSKFDIKSDFIETARATHLNISERTIRRRKKSALASLLQDPDIQKLVA